MAQPPPGTARRAGRVKTDAALAARRLREACEKAGKSRELFSNYLLRQQRVLGEDRTLAAK